MDELPPEPHDAHVVLAKKLFRDCGFTIEAMRYKRPLGALIALKRFNRVPDDWKHPIAWEYHPNAYCRDFWLQHGRLA